MLCLRNYSSVCTQIESFALNLNTWISLYVQEGTREARLAQPPKLAAIPNLLTFRRLSPRSSNA